MPHHHGDPRSDVTGEQPFDMNEYPGPHYTPPAPPPAPGNVNNFIPYRGQELHGKQLTRNSHDGYLPYASEQHAQDAYTSDVTPRDLIPPKPVPVVIKDTPDLLYRRRARAASWSVAGGTQVQVLQRDHTRKRAIITVTSSGANQPFYYGTDPDASAPVQALGTATSTTAQILDTATTGALYVSVPAAGVTITVSTWVESVDSDGDPLL